MGRIGVATAIQDAATAIGSVRFAVLGIAAALMLLIFTKIATDKTENQDQEPTRRVSFIEPKKDFDWQTEEPRKLRPIKPIYHITMGLQADTPCDLITIDKDYLSRVTLRKKLLKEYPHIVHGCTDDGVDAVKELYSYLLNQYLPSRYPSIFQLRQKKLHNHVTGASFSTIPPEDAEECLRVLGETVEEDMFLLRETPEGHQCIAFECCFPSGFNPSEKLGLLLKDVHGPVPGYDKIGPSMERFFSKIAVGGNVKRTNWSIQTHGELLNCKGNHTLPGETPGSDQDVDISKTFFRVELQTLSRLPATRAILFSFKTYLYPMEEIKKEGSGLEMADAIEGLLKGNAKGMWTYKSAVRWGKSVCEYLRS